MTNSLKTLLTRKYPLHNDFGAKEKWKNWMAADIQSNCRCLFSQWEEIGGRQIRVSNLLSVSDHESGVPKELGVFQKEVEQGNLERCLFALISQKRLSDLRGKEHCFLNWSSQSYSFTLIIPASKTAFVGEISTLKTSQERSSCPRSGWKAVAELASDWFPGKCDKFLARNTMCLQTRR